MSVRRLDLKTRVEFIDHHTGELRTIREPDALATARQLILMNARGMLVVVEPWTTHPVTRGNAAWGDRPRCQAGRRRMSRFFDLPGDPHPCKSSRETLRRRPLVFGALGTATTPPFRISPSETRGGISPLRSRGGVAYSKNPGAA
jgi:hypothetical protein